PAPIRCSRPSSAPLPGPSDASGWRRPGNKRESAPPWSHAPRKSCGRPAPATATSAGQPANPSTGTRATGPGGDTPCSLALPDRFAARQVVPGGLTQTPAGAVSAVDECPCWRGCRALSPQPASNRTQAAQRGLRRLLWHLSLSIQRRAPPHVLLRLAEAAPADPGRGPES